MVPLGVSIGYTDDRSSSLVVVEAVYVGQLYRLAFAIGQLQDHTACAGANDIAAQRWTVASDNGCHRSWLWPR